MLNGTIEFLCLKIIFDIFFGFYIIILKKALNY